MKAIRVLETGGPEKLIYEDVQVPSPGPGEALVKIQAIGLNFIDIYFRTGLYKSPLPFIPGQEAAGISRKQPAFTRVAPRLVDKPHQEHQAYQRQ